jgi:hypothetical protein
MKFPIIAILGLVTQLEVSAREGRCSGVFGVMQSAMQTGNNNQLGKVGFSPSSICPQRFYLEMKIENDLHQSANYTSQNPSQPSCNSFQLELYKHIEHTESIVDKFKNENGSDRMGCDNSGFLVNSSPESGSAYRTGMPGLQDCSSSLTGGVWSDGGVCSSSADSLFIDPGNTMPTTTLVFSGSQEIKTETVSYSQPGEFPNCLTWLSIYTGTRRETYSNEFKTEDLLAEIDRRARSFSAAFQSGNAKSTMWVNGNDSCGSAIYSKYRIKIYGYIPGKYYIVRWSITEKIPGSTVAIPRIFFRKALAPSTPEWYVTAESDDGVNGSIVAPRWGKWIPNSNCAPRQGEVLVTLIDVVEK